jgi:hypothetical protein
MVYRTTFLDETINTITNDIITINNKNVFIKLSQIRDNLYKLMILDIMCTDIIKIISNSLFDKIGNST